MNFIDVTVSTDQVLVHSDFKLALPPQWHHLKPGDRVTLGIRPEHLSLTEQDTNSIPVTIAMIEALGHETYLSCRLADLMLQARIDPELMPKMGDRVWLAPNLERIHLFDPSGAALQPQAEHPAAL